MNNDYEQTAKAKSRISSTRIEPIRLDTSHKKPDKTIRSNHNKPSWLEHLYKNHKKSSGTTSALSLPALLIHTRVVWLVLAIILCTSIAIIFVTVRPSSIANILLYQSYFPLTILSFAALVMLGKSIFLQTRKAILFGLFFSLLLLLRLQSVELNIVTVITPLVFLVTAELIISLVFRK